MEEPKKRYYKTDLLYKKALQDYIAYQDRILFHLRKRLEKLKKQNNIS